MRGLSELVQGLGLQEQMSVSGHPSWSFLNLHIAEEATLWTLKTFLMQELLDRGFLALGTHAISWAQTEKDITALLAAYGEILPLAQEGLRSGTLRKMLRCEPLKPLFRVR